MKKCKKVRIAACAKIGIATKAYLPEALRCDQRRWCRHPPDQSGQRRSIHGCLIFSGLSPTSLTMPMAYGPVPDPRKDVGFALRICPVRFIVHRFLHRLSLSRPRRMAVPTLTTHHRTHAQAWPGCQPQVTGPGPKHGNFPSNGSSSVMSIATTRHRRRNTTPRLLRFGGWSIIHACASRQHHKPVW